MRRLVWSLPVLLALALVGSAAALAQDATPGGTPAGTALALPPDATVGGATLGEWSARWNQWLLSFPNASSPIFDETGERCASGQHGPVFFLAASLLPELDVARACTVPAGTALFVPLHGFGCSTVEPPPYFGRGEAELRACAKRLTDAPVDQTLTVDGATIPTAPYRHQSPLHRIALPPDNLLGVAPTVAAAVLDGYDVLLAPLPVGTHTVVIEVVEPGGPPFRLTHTLTVVEPAVIPPPATPEAATPAA